jgi:hypothetical protein
VESAYTGVPDAWPMFAPRTATGLTLALLALPATATATPSSPSLSGFAGGGETTPAHSRSLPYRDYYGATGLVQPSQGERTSSPAGPTSPSISPDAADAARAGDIAKAMEHYQRSQPIPAAARPASPPDGGYRQVASDDDTPAWPEVAFAGLVLLATAGGVVRVRMRRARRVVA